MSALSYWWSQRAARERQLLGLGAAVLCLLLAWLSVIEPLETRVAAAGRLLAAERATGAWLEAVAPAAGEPAPTSLAEGETALAALNDSVRAAGLDTTLKRMTPTGEAAFELGFEGAAWQPLAGWLQNLSETRGVRVAAAHIEHAGVPGMVNATLSIEFLAGSAGNP